METWLTRLQKKSESPYSSYGQPGGTFDGGQGIGGKSDINGQGTLFTDEPGGKRKKKNVRKKRRSNISQRPGEFEPDAVLHLR